MPRIDPNEGAKSSIWETLEIRMKNASELSGLGC